MYNRKFTKTMAMLLLLTMMLNMLLPVSAAAAESNGGDGDGTSILLEESFACWTMNGETKIDSVLTDEKYVLTIPHDMAAADVVVYFTGTVTETSAGELVEEDKKITGAFAGAAEVTLTGGENSYIVVLEQEEPPVVQDPFTCWTMNGETKINAVLTDGKYVLLIPQDMEAASVEVFFTGAVTAASAGALVAEENKVTGAFAEGAEVILSNGENCYIVVVQQEETVTDDASGTCGENLTWVLDDEGTLTISGMGDMENYDDQNVSPWFEYREQIKTVVISSGVTSVGDAAFSYYNGGYVLTSVTVGDDVTSIGDSAFYCCHRLNDVTIGDSVTHIGDYAFCFCNNLTSIVIPDSVTSIGEGVFSICEKLEQIVVGENNTSYFSDANGILFNKDQTVLVRVPGAFTGAYVIPSSVTEIGVDAFGSCKGLTDVTIPDSVVSIGEGAFYNCNNLISVTIPESVIDIGVVAFGECSGLTSVAIPDSVVSISRFAFNHCKSLTSVTIGKGVTTIGVGAFADCSALTDVYYEGTEEQWDEISIDSENDCLTDAMIHFSEPEEDSNPCGENLTWKFEASTGTLTISGSGAMEDYTLTTGNTAPWADYGDRITELVLEEGVTTIGDFAFNNFSALEKAAFPTSLTRVGESAFYQFERIQSDGTSVFYHMPFTAKIDQTVQQWYTVELETGNEGFPGWDTVTFVNEAPVVDSGKAGDNIYWELNQDGILEYFGTGNMYSFGATGSPLYDQPVKTIIIGEGIEDIGECAFKGVASDSMTQHLESVIIASTVEAIGVQAFGGCSNLSTIIFSGNAPVIAENAFNGVTATAYYPADNATWASEVMQNYGGTITWEQEDTTAFSCHTYDEKGNPIDAYWSEKDGIWYLFVPSTVSVSEMVMSYTGSVAEVSSGALNMAESVVTDAFSESGDVIILKDTDDEEYKVQVMQSNLPSVHIVLNGATLSDVHKDKDVKYENNSVYIMDPEGTYDLTVEGSVEMKGRGNTSWQWYEKKGYQIKFESKTSVLGMGKAKKWVLLANASDDSMMRTSLTYRMAEHLDMAFVPDMEYVDLWVNGEYRGTYMIGDKVELGSSRLDLQHDQGALFEHDEEYYAAEDWWFVSNVMQRHFVMKEIVEETDACIEDAMTDFEAAVDAFMMYLISTPAEDVTINDLSTMIDVDSFVKYYLVSEYVLNKEAVYSSFYWYKDGPEDVIHLGPIWDYDTCIGNQGAAYTEYHAHNHLMLGYLLAAPAFRERAETLKSQYWCYLTGMAEDADVVKAMIEGSAKMNYLRWDSLGRPSNKDESNFADTFEKAVANVQAWLRGRSQVFEIRSVNMVYGAVSDRSDKLEIYYDDADSGYTNVKFAVWHDTEKQTDLRWYDAARDADGILRATADLVKHNGTGPYYIDAYTFKADGSKTKIAAGQSYVKSLYVPDYTIEAAVPDDCETMEISFTDIKQHENIHFAVWSDVDGQDDLHWYASQEENGNWTYTADLREHSSAGQYHIHVYSLTDGVYTKHAEHRVYVEKAVASPVTVVVSENCEVMEIVFAEAEQHEQIHFAVWSDEGGQDDLNWYAAAKNAAGEWVYSANLRTHNTAGKYHIHVYSVAADGLVKQAEYTETVEKVADSPVAVAVSENKTTMTIAFKDSVDHEYLQFAVWSDADGQDDLHWYTAEKVAAGQWTYTVDLQNHQSEGTYHIHVYSIEAAALIMQIAAAAKV